MKNLYRYRVEPFHWLFTNFLKSSATVRYDLRYQTAERAFVAEQRERQTAMHEWSRPIVCTCLTTEVLRALLMPEDLAACAAASMVRMNDADA